MYCGLLKLGLKYFEFINYGTMKKNVKMLVIVNYKFSFFIAVFVNVRLPTFVALNFSLFNKPYYY
jgi:hypothetical protein